MTAEDDGVVARIRRFLFYDDCEVCGRPAPVALINSDDPRDGLISIHEECVSYYVPHVLAEGFDDRAWLHYGPPVWFDESES